jgi:plastocyanin
MQRSGRRTSIGIRLAGVLVLPALVLTSCSDDDGEEADTADTTSSAPGASDPETGNTTTSAAGTDGSTTTAAAGGDAVAIADYAFSPTPLTVAAGTTVTWTNADDFDHTTTADDGAWDSGPLSTGDPFEHTFEEPGTFAYHCDIHNFMQAEIVVE